MSILALSLLLAAAPPELGDVSWSRDFEAAKEDSKRSGKPIFILFDEVPGCQTCVRYGQAVLTHPLIVEAAESLFVPVVIYNNLGGADKEVLKRFGEPTWNNPVVRMVDAEEHTLAPRLAGDHSRAALVKTMVRALREAERPVPKYLVELAAEFGARAPRKAVLGMYCFWSGEGCLGGMQGVLSSRTGFAGGHEVVEITYDSEEISYEQLLAGGSKAGCFSSVLTSSMEQRAKAERLGLKVQDFDGRVRGSPEDDKHRLAHTALRSVPLTPRQSSRVNAAISNREDPLQWLSPVQAEMAKRAAQTDAAPRFERNGSQSLAADFRRARAAYEMSM